MIRTTDLDRAAFCSGRAIRVLLEPLSAVPLEISPVVLPLADNHSVTKPATGVADDRTQLTRGTASALTNNDRPNTPQQITTQQHSKTNRIECTAGRRSPGNPVTHTTYERPEISDHDLEYHTMARIDARLPPGLAQLLEASGECGLFRGKSDAARTALRAYFDQNPEIAMAAIRELVSESDNDGEGMTLDEAVRLTGQSPSTFSEELRAVLCANADPQQEDGSNGT